MNEPLKLEESDPKDSEVLISITFPLRTKIYFFFRDLKAGIRHLLGIKSKGKTFFEMQAESAELMRRWKIDVIKAPESMERILRYGWYLPHHVNEATINYLADNLGEGNVSHVDDCIMEILDRDCNADLDKLNSRFPSRAKAISSAFDAHRRGEYYLSIPVFFSQTEGICKIIIGSRFFSVKKGKPITKDWASRPELSDYITLLLKPLTEVGESRRSQDDGNPSGANRHDVLHGDSTEYGTKVNSYKALSLLIYVGITVYELDEILSKKTGEP
jgi:hypothetical protein